ncbi:MAG: RNA polymerase sigma factor [Candidatus Promineifilaceae bacterium]|nr:RNA polymerase sigma factor [Candidatus Promineifilaceae bacterium]
MTSAEAIDQAAETVSDQLIRQARQGHPAAWERLIRDHEEHIFRLAYLVLRDAAEAEDVAQETFVRAFLALDDFELGRPLRPWLTRIAVNLARNRRRALGRYLKYLWQAWNQEPKPPPESKPMERAVEGRWRAGRLWEAVQRLRQIDQDVIYLRYFLGMSEAEMAAALEVAPGTVKSRLHRALKRLRQLVEVDFPELAPLIEEAE